MSLKDLDRPAVTFRYEPWGRELIFRRMDARSYIRIAGECADIDGEDVDSPTVIRFYAALLAASCEDPSFSQEEWLEASGQTLLMLGQEALRINGMQRDEAKKNSTTPSTDSPSSSAES